MWKYKDSISLPFPFYTKFPVFAVFCRRAHPSAGVTLTPTDLQYNRQLAKDRLDIRTATR